MKTFKSIILPALCALAMFNIALLIGVYGFGATEYSGIIGICAGICVTTFLLAVDPWKGHID
jgi:hypothetical protein